MPNICANNITAHLFCVKSRIFGTGFSGFHSCGIIWEAGNQIFGDSGLNFHLIPTSFTNFPVTHVSGANLEIQQNLRHGPWLYRLAHCQHFCYPRVAKSSEWMSTKGSSKPSKTEKSTSTNRDCAPSFRPRSNPETSKSAITPKKPMLSSSRCQLRSDQMRQAVSRKIASQPPSIVNSLSPGITPSRISPTSPPRPRPSCPICAPATWWCSNRPPRRAPPRISLPQFSKNPACKAGIDFHLAYSPERVLPGQILRELIENARVIGGIDAASAQAGHDLYATFVRGEIIQTTATTAEMVKLMENTTRDVNIAIANEFARLAERFGVDVWEAISLANLHPRINILRPGPGVGGHCISVDPWFLVEAAPDLTPLIHTARTVNDAQPAHVVERLSDRPSVNLTRQTYRCSRPGLQTRC